MPSWEVPWEMKDVLGDLIASEDEMGVEKVVGLIICSELGARACTCCALVTGIFSGYWTREQERKNISLKRKQ